MAARRRGFLTVTIGLLGQIGEFAYWILAIALMVVLIRRLEEYPFLMYAGVVGYIVAVILLYFFVLRRLKARFGDDPGEV